MLRDGGSSGILMVDGCLVNDRANIDIWSQTRARKVARRRVVKVSQNRSLWKLVATVDWRR